MNRRNVVRLALAAALFGAAIPGAALAQVTTKWWTPNQVAQRFQRDMFEGRWLAQGRFDANNRGGRVNQLPNFLRIDQQRRLVSVMDRGSNLLQLISIDNGFHTQRRGTTLLHGDLNGNRLVANGRDARGRLVRQVMILRDRGNTLVVRTQVERGNSGRMVEVEKVYQRA